MYKKNNDRIRIRSHVKFVDDEERDNLRVSRELESENIELWDISDEKAWNMILVGDMKVKKHLYCL